LPRVVLCRLHGRHRRGIRSELGWQDRSHHHRKSRDRRQSNGCRCHGCGRAGWWRHHFSTTGDRSRARDAAPAQPGGVRQHGSRSARDRAHALRWVSNRRSRERVRQHRRRADVVSAAYRELLRRRRGSRGRGADRASATGQARHLRFGPTRRHLRTQGPRSVRSAGVAASGGRARNRRADGSRHPGDHAVRSGLLCKVRWCAC
jgi:hypothetical protein